MKTAVVLTILAVFFTIFSHSYDRAILWFIKPLPVLIIMSWVLLKTQKNLYRHLILTGLFFSMIGDALLVAPELYFKQGLISFLCAHLFYAVAFLKAKLFFNFKSLFAYLVTAILYLSVANGISEDLKISVVVYTFAISTMLMTALNFWLTTKNCVAQRALIGAVFFIFSDWMIAFNKFNHPFKEARILILITYFSAQWLIASSLQQSISTDNKNQTIK